MLRRTGLARHLGTAGLERRAHGANVADAERKVAEAGAEVVAVGLSLVVSQFDHRVGPLRPVAHEGVGEPAAGIVIASQ